MLHICEYLICGSECLVLYIILLFQLFYYKIIDFDPFILYEYIINQIINVIVLMLFENDHHKKAKKM